MNRNIPEYIKDIFVKIIHYEKSQCIFKYRHKQKLFSVEFPGTLYTFEWFSIKQMLALTGYKVMYRYNTVYIYDVDDFELLHGVLKLHVS